MADNQTTMYFYTSNFSPPNKSNSSLTSSRHADGIMTNQTHCPAKEASRDGLQILPTPIVSQIVGDNGNLSTLASAMMFVIINHAGLFPEVFHPCIRVTRIKYILTF